MLFSFECFADLVDLLVLGTGGGSEITVFMSGVIGFAAVTLNTHHTSD